MQRYILRRVLQSIPLLIGITIVVFLLVHAAPGNPLGEFEFNPNIKPEDIARIRSNLGLDKPLYEQYFLWVSGMLRGDFGVSLITGRPVLEQIGERLPKTLLLSLTALVLAIGLSIPIGVYAAVKRGSWFDQVATVTSTMGQAIPSFWFGLIMILVFSVRFKELGWPSFPSGGVTTPGQPFSLADLLHHLAMPAFVLAFINIAGWTRYVRSSLLETINQDFVRTAHAKGLHDRTVIFRHALRNSLIPVVTLMGLALPGLVSGALVIEVIFSWPGIGRLAFDAARSRDYTTIMGLVTITSSLVVLGNLLADITYGLLDPRIKYQ
ncbi:MAG: ABC transporter permease [Anaerolineae bacterium]|nr:ABC transporter permease [Anaerolineae bacterium]